MSDSHQPPDGPIPDVRMRGCTRYTEILPAESMAEVRLLGKGLAVAQGRADWGVAIRVVADQHGLDFLPLGWEQYDFVLRKSRENLSRSDIPESTSVRGNIAVSSRSWGSGGEFASARRANGTTAFRETR
jgi:hypothetical protein